MDSFSTQHFRTALSIIGVVVMIANMWLFSQLAPLAQQVALIEQRVSSLEENNVGSTTVSNTVRLSVLEQQYVRIETKLDAVLTNQGR